MTVPPTASKTPIKGLLEIQLDLRGDDRGWFQEVWQQEKWLNHSFPQFLPVQQNTSSNIEVGVTRGLHAEPWNKVVTVLAGKAFCVWVDLRPGPDFGKAHWRVLEAGQAAYVPRGVANGYQTLEPNTVYSYLVDDHWSPEAKYVLLNLFDPKFAIPWPIAKEHAIVSEKDHGHPKLDSLGPMPDPQVVIVGPKGQVGSELCKLVDTSLQLDRAALLRPSTDWKWQSGLGVGSIVFNSAAFTSVDAAELPESWSEANTSNALLPSLLADLTRQTKSTLVHFSSDYVFDGTSKELIREEADPNPLSVYGRTKLLGDFGAMRNPRHYILRTSWVYGSGKNFVDSMKAAALAGRELQVVDDQFGRPTRAKDLASAAVSLTNIEAPFGVYNFTGSGAVVSWFELARYVYEVSGSDPDLVQPTSTEEFARGRAPFAPRPTFSGLDLAKIQSLGIETPDWRQSVREHLEAN